MRAEDDWSFTYLLDAAFESFLKGRDRGLLPKEVKAAVKFGIPMGREHADTA
jgi:hypothetical protein